MSFLLLSFLASPIFPSPSIERRPKFLRTMFTSCGRRQASQVSQTSQNTKPKRRFKLIKRSIKAPPPPALPENMELMTFLSQECPEDVLPKILAYCGPQKVAALSQTCHQWSNIILNDATWRILCEELYKWSDGDELPSTSWKEYYQNNPCVPIDYPSVQRALAVVESTTNDGGGGVYQTRSIRILLRPGDHVLKEAITIQATQDVSITMETMRGNFSCNHAIAQEERTLPTQEAINRRGGRLARRAAKLRNRISRRSSSQDEDALWDVTDLQHPLVERLSSPPKMDVASLILHTRKNNEPLLRIKQGSIILRNLEILHNSHGMDIWNGNAAIQIQPNKNQLQVDPRPSMIMQSVEVVSHSGRGIVNIDGGYLGITNSYVHDCAATGIYVGGEGTQALIERTDVLQNGNGTRNRRGVGRGHSGVYLEQGKAIIRDCNISRNSLTGISAVSRHNTTLQMEASDLVANGAAQLEMPRGSSAQESWDLERNNRLAAIGLLRSRSSLVPEPPEALPETAL